MIGFYESTLTMDRNNKYICMCTNIELYLSTPVRDSKREYLMISKEWK